VVSPVSTGPGQRVAVSLGVGDSTLERWITTHLKQGFDGALMAKDKRPRDWSKQEKLDLIIAMAGLDEEAASALCRERGIFQHQVAQWREDLVSEDRVNRNRQEPTALKELQAQIVQLQRELRRKDKALAEAAALLVLQKKVNQLWGDDEDS